MGTLSTYFKPESHQPLIEDKGKRERLFKYWRWRILYATFIGYAVYYFTRGTLPLVLPELKKMGYDEVYLGWMLTAFQLFYGVSKFANGVWADKANPRYFMAIGLMMTGVVSIFFGLSMSIWAFMIFWTLNGWFQGCGSAPCHKLLSHWYRTSERGRWWSVWNTSHNVGAALLPILGVVLLSNWGWQSLMFVPAAIAILTGFFLINRLRDTPQSQGLPPVEFLGKNIKPSEVKEKELSFKEILWDYVLKNPFLWLLAVAYFMVYIIRWTLSHWIFYYLVEIRGFEAWFGAKCLVWYEVGGFVGGLAAGYVSDLLFKGKRGVVHILFFASLIPLLFVFSQVSQVGSQFFLIQVVLTGIGFFIFGPQMLLAVHAVEVTHKKASSTAVGFLGIIAYVGSAMTGGPLGYMVKHSGWQSVFTMMAVCASVGMCAIVPLLKKRKQPLVLTT